MGSARAPVLLSGIWPAWMARVSGWNWRSLITATPSHRPSGRDDLRVHAGPVEAAEQARVFDLHAAVPDAVQAGGGGDAVGFLALQTKLLPQAFRADGDSALRNGRDVGLLAEHVDHVDGEGDFFEPCVTLLAQDLGVLGVHGHDAVAVLL